MFFCFARLDEMQAEKQGFPIKKLRYSHAGGCSRSFVPITRYPREIEALGGAGGLGGAVRGGAASGGPGALGGAVPEGARGGVGLGGAARGGGSAYVFFLRQASCG